MSDEDSVRNAIGETLEGVAAEAGVPLADLLFSPVGTGVVKDEDGFMWGTSDSWATLDPRWSPGMRPTRLILVALRLLGSNTSIRVILAGVASGGFEEGAWHAEYGAGEIDKEMKLLARLPPDDHELVEPGLWLLTAAHQAMSAVDSLARRRRTPDEAHALVPGSPNIAAPISDSTSAARFWLRRLQEMSSAICDLLDRLGTLDVERVRAGPIDFEAVEVPTWW